MTRLPLPIVDDPMQRLSLRTLPILLLLFVVHATSGCDSNSDSTPPVEEVVVIGTQVTSDFLNTGEFGLSATPLDDAGSGIIADDVEGSVTIEAPAGAALVAKSDGGLGGTVTLERLNEASGNPLAVVVNIDGSGSMTSTDPERLRVAGAQAFVDQLETSGDDYEVALTTYGGFSPEFDLSSTRMLLDFSNDAAALRDSTELVRASGGTPTYESLAELLVYSENERPAANFQKAIVLLSDGSPNSVALRDSVCSDAQRKESPIYSIGLGPASDLSPAQEQSQGAIDEMRSVSLCTGAAYAGIDPDDAAASTDRIYRAIATGTSQGSILFRVAIDPDALQQHFAPGDVLRGTVELTAGGQSASGDFSFSIPDPAAAATYQYLGE